MKIQRECPICGVLYNAEANRLKFGRQTTCSRACSYALRAGKTQNKVTIKCPVCGKDFCRPRSHIKGKSGKHFCSAGCAYKARSMGIVKRVVCKPYVITPAGRKGWEEGAKKTRETRIQRNNYRHTEETIAKLRDATARAIFEGRIPARSKLEEDVLFFLRDAGIPFQYQSPVRGDGGRYVCVFDFFLQEHNIVLEVNGTFWHADPRFFPDGPIHSSQKRNALKWAEKLAVVRRLGYRLIEVWEYDIKKEGAEYLARVLMPAIR